MLLAMAVWLTGCGGSSKNSNNDAGVTTVQVCVPNAASCFNDTIALTCTSTGSAEIPVQCGSGQKCTNGACVATTNAACTSAANACADATHATLCTSSGTMSMTCPTGTTCAGPGLCQGACVVGSSICLDDGTLSICNDGMTYTSMACGTGMGCVATGTSPYDTAACKTAACKPDPNGCNFKCGDLTGGSGTAANTLSTCVPTPDGFKWLAVTCTSAQTCSPSGAACTGSNGGFQAACTSQCNPGDTRCTADHLGYETCGTNGTWGGSAACNTDPTQAKYACVPSAAGEGVCADLACIAQPFGGSLVPSGQGVCDSSGKFHACGPDGKVSTDAQACTNGTCVTKGNPEGGLNPGQCVTECQNGDARCVGGSSYQTCANGLWSTSTQCANGKGCLDTTAMNGQPAYFCGDCLPGTYTCGGTNNAQIVACGSDGTIGTPADCAMGICEQTAGGGLCLLECTPGGTLCTGGNMQDPSTGIYGTASQGTCTAKGLWPAPADTTPCTAPTVCRKSASGASLGCVTCVGSDNEFGLTDTRCENADDTAGANGTSGGYIESCKADNSGWDIANHTQCIAPNATCQPASTNISIAPPGSFCQLLPIGPNGLLATASNINAFLASQGAPPGAQLGCAAGPGLGLPESCGLAGGGSVPDCCSNECQETPQPNPAYCN